MDLRNQYGVNIEYTNFAYSTKNSIRMTIFWRGLAGTLWSALFLYCFLIGCAFLNCGKNWREPIFSWEILRFIISFVASHILRTIQLTGIF